MFDKKILVGTVFLSFSNIQYPHSISGLKSTHRFLSMRENTGIFRIGQLNDYLFRMRASPEAFIRKRIFAMD